MRLKRSPKYGAAKYGNTVPHTTAVVLRQKVPEQGRLPGQLFDARGHTVGGQAAEGAHELPSSICAGRSPLRAQEAAPQVCGRPVSVQFDPRLGTRAADDCKIAPALSAGEPPRWCAAPYPRPNPSGSCEALQGSEG
jgi:hypothetical protein